MTYSDEAVNGYIDYGKRKQQDNNLAQRLVSGGLAEDEVYADTRTEHAYAQDGSDLIEDRQRPIRRHPMMHDGQASRRREEAALDATWVTSAGVEPHQLRMYVIRPADPDPTPFTRCRAHQATTKRNLIHDLTVWRRRKHGGAIEPYRLAAHLRLERRDNGEIGVSIHFHLAVVVHYEDREFAEFLRLRGWHVAEEGYDFPECHRPDPAALASYIGRRPAEQLRRKHDDDDLTVDDLADKQLAELYRQTKGLHFSSPLGRLRAFVGELRRCDQKADFDERGRPCIINRVPPSPSPRRKDKMFRSTGIVYIRRTTTWICGKLRPALIVRADTEVDVTPEIIRQTFYTSCNENPDLLQNNSEADPGGLREDEIPF